MMGEQVNVVIDHLCEKFGTQTEQLLTEIAKLKIAEFGFGVIVSVLIVIVCIGAIIYIVRKNKVDEYCYGDEIMLIAFLGLVIALIAALAGGGCLIGWMAAPRAKAILYIMEML